MAAVKIDADRTWKVANWVYKGVMDEAIHVLVPETELVRNIQETIVSNILYLSYLELPTESRQIFRGAIECGLANALSKGPIGFAQPEYYAAFIEQFRDLIKLLKPQV